VRTDSGLNEDAMATSYCRGMVEMLVLTLKAAKSIDVGEVALLLEQSNAELLKENPNTEDDAIPEIRVIKEAGDGLPYIIDGIVTYDPPSEAGYGMR
jgi:hypothetical protein